MSEKGRFDAVIDILNFCLTDGDLREHTEKMIKWSKKEREKQARQAVRILEMAGRVEKENALWNIDEAFSQSRDHVQMMAPYKEDHNLENYNRADKEITALLESLPEKRKSIDKEK